MTRKSLISALFLLLTILAPLDRAAAATNERSYEFYESAISLFNTKDYRGAAIQLRNSLQQDPKNLAARVLLGKTLLKLGDGAGAEGQLFIARNTGADEANIIVPLGSALLLQQKHDLLLKELRIGNRPPHLEARVRYFRGQAHLELRELSRAENNFETALRLFPDDSEILLGLTRLRKVQGNLTAAEKLVDRALKVSPDLADAWYTKGDLLRARRQFTAAVQYYDRAIALADTHVPARLGRAAALIDSGAYKKAQPDVSHVRKALPNNIQAAYLQAMILTRDGKYGKADEILREAANSLSAADPDEILSSPRATLLRGLIYYSRHQFDDAYPYLSRFVEIVPHHAGARKMLGDILLTRGESGPAATVLEVAADLAPDDVDVQTLLGNAHMRNKEYRKAGEAFRQAIALAPDNSSLKTRLALSQLAMGNSGSAIEGLESVVSENSSINNADILLGMVQLRNGDTKAALRISTQLASKDPGNPFPANLSGLAHLQAGRNDEARKSFQRALELAPNYAPPRFNLASLDMSEGNADAAKQHYLKILEQRPSEIRAMTGLARIAERSGNLDSAISWLDKVRKIDDDTIGPQIKLIQLYLQARRHDAALRLVYALEQKQPKNHDVLNAKAQTEIASGKTTKAIATYRQAAYAAREVPPRLLHIARQQINLRDFEGAQSSLKSLISQKPDYIPAHVALVNLEARSGGLDKALALAQALRAGYPDIPAGDLLVGDMLARLGRYQNAETAYSAGLAKQNSPVFATRLFQIRKRQGRTRDGLAELEEWDRINPGQAAVQRVLAAAYMGTGDTARAIQAHELFIEVRPKDPAILNNLALLYEQTNDPRALDIAARAFALAPGSPAIMDTYGWILVKYGEAARGLRHLREAQARASGRLEIRYHIAVALKELGRSDEAQQELYAILRSNEDFAQKPAAQALLQALQGSVR